MSSTRDDDSGIGGGLPRTAEAAKRLASGAAQLSARRQRDALPVRIETSRLVLRAPIRGDVPDLVKLADNTAISEMLSRMPSPYTRADAIAFVEIMAQRADERPYAITWKGSLVGTVGFSYGLGAAPELGYWLGQPFWGKGLMTEAVRALLDAAHDTKQYPLIAARALKDNTASITVLERTGFRRVDERPSRYEKFAGRTVVLFEREQPKWM